MLALSKSEQKLATQLERAKEAKRAPNSPNNLILVFFFNVFLRDFSPKLGNFLLRFVVIVGQVRRPYKNDDVKRLSEIEALVDQGANLSLYLVSGDGVAVFLPGVYPDADFPAIVFSVMNHEVSRF